MIAERPVFWSPPSGPTENTIVCPAFNLTLAWNGTFCSTAVTVDWKITFRFATTPTKTPIPYWAPLKLPFTE